ncbi:OPT family small oligopeptide transporter [Kwoniella newhampshirensis]|uniref:OPT family small oligopeptide transporter n=1 Tax=Kwoniella newhampshirensis TaxID=1651941 RepID=A0AAW0YN60_9TREE
MSKNDEITVGGAPALQYSSSGSDHLSDEHEISKTDEKDVYAGEGKATVTVGAAGLSDLQVTGDDFIDAEKQVDSLSIEDTIAIMKQVKEFHQYDQNFPHNVMMRVNEFLDADDLTDPQYRELIHEMKVEAILVTENSPYAEVRAIVDNFDEPELAVSTFRAYLIGTLFVFGGAFVNQLFTNRQPSVVITANVAQLLAYPAGTGLAKILPDWGFNLFGSRVSLNPGPFNKKEHMLITIMATVGFQTPYTNNIIISQYLPIYFNQSYAGSFAYQILGTLSTNFIGYGLAGLTRDFLVFPGFCVWPASLPTVALNKAFHDGSDTPVYGPLGRLYSASKLKVFYVIFAASFLYFWLPGFLFQNLSYFNWMTWIAPDNIKLAAVTGGVTGLGFNPLSTFDYNQITVQLDPLATPVFSVLNNLFGMVVAGFMILGFWFNNIYETAHFPINSNKAFDNTGKRYQILKIIDEKGMFVYEKYQQYSMAYLGAGNAVVYIFFFAVYSATFSYVILFHRHEIVVGFKRLLRRRKQIDGPNLSDDIHMRLMRQYKEVPHWWYGLTMLAAMGCGFACVAAFETYTTPAVVIYGVLMALIACVPIGMIAAVTGIQVTLNVLAEFIGGAWVSGNALAMNYFKMYGYVTTAHTLFFANDLKLAHYLKIPPRATFTAQMWATLVSSFVCTAVLNYTLKIDNLCTADAPFGLTCPGINTFFTAAVLWGTVGPHRIFGPGGQYTLLLIGFPIGFISSFAYWYARKRAPTSKFIRSLHPVMIFTGGIYWSPYNLTNFLGAAYVSAFSWLYIRPRHLAFWSKFNYIVSAALAAGVAVASVIIFFSTGISERSVDWWGNEAYAAGCDGEGCVLQTVAKGEYFGPRKGTFL